MSRLNELLRKLCPNGVPFKTLGEVGTFARGSGLQKSDLVDAGFPAIHYGQIHTYYGTHATETLSFVAPDYGRSLRKAKPGDLVIATTSEDDEAVGKAVAWIGKSEVAVSGDAYVYHHTLEPKYVSYFFQSEQFRSQKARYVTGAKVRRLSGDSLAKIRIPVPPRKIQREIANLLDRFYELEAELEKQLETELVARRRQYTHHRELLLTSWPSGTRRVPMGEIGEFIRGRRFTKNDMVAEGIPSIHYGEIYTHYGVSTESTVSHVRRDLAGQLRYAQPRDVVIAAVGETVEDVAKAVAWLGDGPVAIHDDTFLFRSEMSPKFVSYFMQTSEFHRQKNKHVARAKVKRLSAEGLAKIAVPVPPLAEQERVVAILDDLGGLIDELSTSLSVELDARRRQYKHYRDQLLTFEELAA